MYKPLALCLRLTWRARVQWWNFCGVGTGQSFYPKAVFIFPYSDSPLPEGFMASVSHAGQTPTQGEKRA